MLRTLETAIGKSDTEVGIKQLSWSVGYPRVLFRFRWLAALFVGGEPEPSVPKTEPDLTIHRRMRGIRAVFANQGVQSVFRGVGHRRSPLSMPGGSATGLSATGA
jgi:hypothetical protein